MAGELAAVNHEENGILTEQKDDGPPTINQQGDLSLKPEMWT